MWNFKVTQGKSEGFNSCYRPSNLSQILFKSSIFWPVWPWNMMHDLEKQWGTSSVQHQALCVISKPSVNSYWGTVQKRPNSGQNLWFFSCDQAALWMVFSVRLSVCPSVRLSVCPSVRLSVCPSVRLSVCLSVCHTFLTMFPSSYHHEIFRSYHLGPG